MAYSTAAQLTYATGNPGSYDDTTLEAIIAQGDKEIDAIVAPHGLTASGDAVTLASIDLAVANLLTRMRVDGTRTASMSIGEMSMGDDFEALASRHRAQALATLDKWIEVQLTSAAERHKGYVYVVNA